MRPLLRFLMCGLAACGTPGDAAPEPEDLVAGAPFAGAAEGTLELPVGTPLAGFTARCGCTDGASAVDERASSYAAAFVESAGLYIRPTIKAVWITNGDRHLVLTKTDLAFAFDGVVEQVTARLEAATGLELDGQVTWSTNHSHSSYGTFSANEGFMLGADRFHRENFERLVEQVTAVALAAWEDRRPAALGFGTDTAFDPDDRIYEDRRPDNDDLVVFPDAGPEQAGKDPTLHVLRVDEADDGEPIAVVFGWGFHPVTFWEENALVSADATATVEMEVAESFVDVGHPVVAMFLQGGAGDANVVGLGDGWRRTEAIGALARDPVLALREATPTTTTPLRLESFGRSIPTTNAAIHVTRNGTVDWRYPTWDGTVEGTYAPDNLVYAPDGTLRADFDEWFNEHGAAFCGYGGLELPVGGLPGVAEPVDGDCPDGLDCNYANCIQVTLLRSLLQAFFYEPGETIELPARGMAQSFAAAARLRPIGVRRPDGTTTEGDVLLSFFPGEPVALYTETWRRRAKAELGAEHTALFGYSMDHEGYLLTAEDWLQGGYEPDITFLGPLSGEWLLESVLRDAAAILGTDAAEPHDPARGPEVYAYPPLPNVPPDAAPQAGTRIDDPVGADLWLPEGFALDLAPRAEVPRVAGQVQLAWIGGDPAVDDVEVALEVRDGDAWRPATSRTGRPITEDFHDFVVTHTPDPRFPASAAQTHRWWTVWQAVGHVHDRASLPLGTYRLRVRGRTSVDTDGAWPWAAAPYEVVGEPFEVVPAPITLTVDGATVRAALVAPDSGFRLVDLDGDVTGANPLRGPLTVTWTSASGGSGSVEVDAGAPVDGHTVITLPVDDATAVEVVDAFGNAGSWEPR